MHCAPWTFPDFGFVSGYTLQKNKEGNFCRPLAIQNNREALQMQLQAHFCVAVEGSSTGESRRIPYLGDSQENHTDTDMKTFFL